MAPKDNLKKDGPLPKKKTATQSGATVVINLPNIYLILYII